MKKELKLKIKAESISPYPYHGCSYCHKTAVFKLSANNKSIYFCGYCMGEWDLKPNDDKLKHFV